MYASFGNQAANISKFFIAFILLFAILPGLIGGRIDDDPGDNLAANYIRAVFFVIIGGYLLVLVKLYEFLTIAVILLILLYRKLLSEARLMGRRPEESTGLLILRFLDKQIHGMKPMLARPKKISFPRFNPEKVIFLLLLAAVLFASAYIRFHDAMIHAAMPLSDSYITLDWMKGVERRRLFYEPGGGVYPRGLSIFMATIHKFSFIDPIYVLKYTGPLNSLLTVAGILYVVYRLTRSKYAGLAVAALYGIGAGLLGSEMERQAATNSQEFALVFFLPTIYFAYKYLKERRQRDFLTAIAGLSVMGLIHTFVYFFAVIAVGINIFVLFLQGPAKNFKDYLKLIFGGVFSAAIAIAPFAVGLLEGIGLHGSSVEFLTDTGDILMKKLSSMDLLALSAFLIFGIFLFVLARKKKKDTFSLLPIFLLILCVFMIYFAGGYITKSTLLDTRTQEIWAVCAALSLGLGFGMVLSRMESRKAGKACSAGVCVLCLALMIHFIGIKPLDPYKMEWDSGVEQYLKISRQYNPKSWTMVAEERQYAMIAGTGFLVTTENFTKDYSATAPFSKNWINIGEHIFIYQQKNIFEVSETNSIYSIEKPKYDKMKTDGEAMKQWLEKFSAAGASYRTFFEDQNIRILYIYNKAYEGQEKKKLWGEQA